jgi:small subunit ribosomal protein S5
MSYHNNKQEPATNAPFEYKEKLVCVRRTAKSRSGGRDMSFSATTVVGDGNGRIGVGSGTAKDVPVAIKKALEAAKCSMVDVKLCNKTLQHAVEGRFGATKVFMRPASEGTGIIAGGAMRAVFEVLGVENVLAKCVKSSNPFNVVKATIAGLTSMIDPIEVSRKRGVDVSEVFIKSDTKPAAGE